MDDPLTRRFSGYDRRPILIGRSGDRVLRLEAAGRAALIAKIAPPDRVALLRDEQARLIWLAGKGVLVPEVVAVLDGDDGALVLVMTALPGGDLATAAAPPAVKAKRLGEALARLHALEARDCPFDETVPVRLARIRAALETKIAPQRREIVRRVERARIEGAARTVCADLSRRVPADEDIVLAHGDPCLPNLMLNGEAFSGFVDCGRAGRADRWLDLELAAGSVRYNLGEAWVTPFFDAYGLDGVDAERMDWHRRGENLL